MRIFVLAAIFFAGLQNAYARVLFYSSQIQAGIQMRVDSDQGLAFEVCPFVNGKIVSSPCVLLNSLRHKLSPSDIGLVQFHYGLIVQDYQKLLDEEISDQRGLRNSAAGFGVGTGTLAITSALQLRHWKSMSISRRTFCAATFGSTAAASVVGVNTARKTQKMLARTIQEQRKVGASIFNSAEPPHDVSSGLFHLMVNILRLALMRSAEATLI